MAYWKLNTRFAIDEMTLRIINIIAPTFSSIARKPSLFVVRTVDGSKCIFFMLMINNMKPTRTIIKKIERYANAVRKPGRKLLISSGEIV